MSWPKLRWKTGPHCAVAGCTAQCKSISQTHQTLDSPISPVALRDSLSKSWLPFISHSLYKFVDQLSDRLDACPPTDRLRSSTQPLVHQPHLLDKSSSEFRPCSTSLSHLPQATSLCCAHESDSLLNLQYKDLVSTTGLSCNCDLDHRRVGSLVTLANRLSQITNRSKPAFLGNPHEPMRSLCDQPARKALSIDL